MQLLIRRISGWAYQSGFMVGKWRSQRMRDFVESVRPPPGARILDLGGTDYNWKLVRHDYHVTIVNLPNGGTRHQNTDHYRFVEGDATNLREMFDDQSFDVVFSNSVIEHVGGPEAQERFRDEVYRLAPAHWVQTPSDQFPLEVHTGIPYYWHLPEAVKELLHRRWKANLPGWYAMVAGTTVLSRARMRELFYRSSLYTEKVFGLEKSYAAYVAFPYDRIERANGASMP
jgi:hypothetical protein